MTKRTMLVIERKDPECECDTIRVSHEYPGVADLLMDDEGVVCPHGSRVRALDLRPEDLEAAFNHLQMDAQATGNKGMAEQAERFYALWEAMTETEREAMTEPRVTWQTLKDGTVRVYGEDGHVDLGPKALRELALQVLTPADCARELGALGWQPKSSVEFGQGSADRYGSVFASSEGPGWYYHVCMDGEFTNGEADTWEEALADAEAARRVRKAQEKGGAQ